MIDLTEDILTEIRAHAEEAFPKESCGVLQVIHGHLRYTRIRNAAERPEDDFVIHGGDFALAEEKGEIVGIVHSHPGVPPFPSECDLVNCERSGLPWVIVNWPTGAVYQFEPSGYEAPLVGRTFSYGTNDCYGLVCDWYLRERGITLPERDRDGFWWEKGDDRYMREFPQYFEQVSLDRLERGDVILMNHNATVANHCAIWLGDGTILHHIMGRLSTVDLYGGYWMKATRAAFRYTGPRE